MDKLRVGIIVYQKSNPTDGGGHSYYSTLLKGINNYSFNSNIEIINVVFYDKHVERGAFKKDAIFIKGGYKYESGLKQSIKKISSENFLHYFFTRHNPLIAFLLHYKISRRNREIEAILKAHKIDVIYYLKHELNVLNYPFIATHWDLAHKSMDVFPETSLDDNYDIRENYFVYTLNKALRIVCESESGAEELLAYYNIYKPKVKVLPIFAGDIIKLQLSLETQLKELERYGLKSKKYFIYPAQFWSFKNHYHLVKAFHHLRSHHPHLGLKLLFTGSDMGNKAYIQSAVNALNMQADVIILDFVTNEALYSFYKHAIALAMPTFLGPTNMPLLEAAHLKCPVICSDLNGHRELLEENALYFDPKNSNEIADAMLQLTDITFGEILAERAYGRVTKSRFNLENTLQSLDAILMETMLLRKTWGYDY